MVTWWRGNSQFASWTWVQIVSHHLFVAAVLIKCWKSRDPYGHEEIRSSQAVGEIVNCRLFVAAVLIGCWESRVPLPCFWLVYDRAPMLWFLMLTDSANIVSASHTLRVQADTKKAKKECSEFSQPVSYLKRLPTTNLRKPFFHESTIL